MSEPGDGHPRFAHGNRTSLRWAIMSVQAPHALDQGVNRGHVGEHRIKIQVEGLLEHLC